MRVGCVQNFQRNEIVVVNRRPVFQAKPQKIAEKTINHFGLDMSTMVGYEGEKSCVPAPLSIGENLAKFFNRMEIDWSTHVDPKKTVRRFE